MTLPDQTHTRRLANAIRMLTVDAVETAKSGHPGLPMGMADVAMARCCFIPCCG
jgi:transketolase